MSYPHSKPSSLGDSFITSVGSPAAWEASLPFTQPNENVVDATLRNVPLPSGMLTRLTAALSRWEDEVSGSIDYLGC